MAPPRPEKADRHGPESQPKAAAQNLVTLGVVLWLLASGLFFWLWYVQYLRFDFNELGRHFDAEAGVVYTDAGFAWCLPAFGCLAIALGMVARRLWRRRGSQASEPRAADRQPPSSHPPP